MVEKVEPRELRILLREATLICPGYFPTDVLDQAAAVIDRTLDSGVLRHELRKKLDRKPVASQPPRRTDHSASRQQSFRSGSQKGSWTDNKRGRSFRRPQFSSATPAVRQPAPTTNFATPGPSYRQPTRATTSRGSSRGSHFTTPNSAPSAATRLPQTSRTQPRLDPRRGAGQVRGRNNRRGAH